MWDQSWIPGLVLPSANYWIASWIARSTSPVYLRRSRWLRHVRLACKTLLWYLGTDSSDVCAACASTSRWFASPSNQCTPAGQQLYEHSIGLCFCWTTLWGWPFVCVSWSCRCSLKLKTLKLWFHSTTGLWLKELASCAWCRSPLSSRCPRSGDRF
jgi:hypothetical protein